MTIIYGGYKRWLGRLQDLNHRRGRTRNLGFNGSAGTGAAEPSEKQSGKTPSVPWWINGWRWFLQHDVIKSGQNGLTKSSVRQGTSLVINIHRWIFVKRVPHISETPFHKRTSVPTAPTTEALLQTRVWWGANFTLVLAPVVDNNPMSHSR